LEKKLKVLEFMVLKAGGVPVFHYSTEGTKTLDELLSGFLSAITSFATEFGEKSVKSLTFEGSELLYEELPDNTLFIFLVEAGASKKILRTVLRDLAVKFMSKFENEMKLEIPVKELFLSFASEVESTFRYYEEVLLVTSSLSAFVIPTLNQKKLEEMNKTEGFLDAFHRDFGAIGTRTLDAVDGKKSIYEISEQLGLMEEDISEIIEYLSISKIIEISNMYPMIGDNDSRFDAYLDLVGLPRKDYQLLQRARPLCDGNRTVIEISNRLGITGERLYEVLIKLGDSVKWKYVKITAVPQKK